MRPLELRQPRARVFGGGLQLLAATFVITCILAVGVDICRASDAAAEDAPVVEALGMKNFDTRTLGSKVWLLDFYSPTCPHCVKLAPTLDQLAVIARKEGLNAGIGKIDCSVERRLCRRFQVRSYPTIIFLDADKRTYTYEGSRSLEDLLRFMKGGYLKSSEGPRAFGLAQRLKGLAGGAVFTTLNTARELLHTLRTRTNAGVAIVVCVLGVLTALLSIIFCIICVGDSFSRRPHVHRD
eukprot:tig00000865_g5109.t1